jgi:hypothetical protein
VPSQLRDDLYGKRLILCLVPNSHFEVHLTLSHCIFKLLESDKHCETIDLIGLVQFCIFLQRIILKHVRHRMNVNLVWRDPVLTHITQILCMFYSLQWIWHNNYPKWKHVLWLGSGADEGIAELRDCSLTGKKFERSAKNMRKISLGPMYQVLGLLHFIKRIKWRKKMVYPSSTETNNIQGIKVVF